MTPDDVLARLRENGLLAKVIRTVKAYDDLDLIESRG